MTRNRREKHENLSANVEIVQIGFTVLASVVVAIVLRSKSLFPLTGLLLACSRLYPDYFLAGLRGQIFFYKYYRDWPNMKPRELDFLCQILKVLFSCDANKLQMKTFCSVINLKKIIYIIIT